MIAILAHTEFIILFHLRVGLHAKREVRFGNILAIQVVECRCADVLVHLTFHVPAPYRELGLLGCEFDRRHLYNDLKTRIAESIDKALSLLWSIIDVAERNFWNLGLTNNLPFIFGKLLFVIVFRIIAFVLQCLFGNFSIKTFCGIPRNPVLGSLVTEKVSSFYAQSVFEATHSGSSGTSIRGFVRPAPSFAPYLLVLIARHWSHIGSDVSINFSIVR